MLVTPLAIGSFWLRNEVLNTHRYVETVTPLSSNAAIDTAVAKEITDELFSHIDVASLAGVVLPKSVTSMSLPVAAALRVYTQTAIVKFLRTVQFRRIWRDANTQAHEALVDALEGKPNPIFGFDGGVSINLANAIAAVRDVLAQEGLHVFDQIKPALLQRRLVIAKGASLRQVRRGVTVLRALAIVLPIVSFALVGLALVLSRRRFRTLVWAGAALTGASLLGIGAVIGLRDYYLHEIVGPNVPRAAALALYDTLLGSLRLDLKLALGIGIAAAAIGLAAGLIRRRGTAFPARGVP